MRLLSTIWYIIAVYTSIRKCRNWYVKFGWFSRCSADIGVPCLPSLHERQAVRRVLQRERGASRCRCSWRWRYHVRQPLSSATRPPVKRLRHKTSSSLSVVKSMAVMQERRWRLSERGSCLCIVTVGFIVEKVYVYMFSHVQFLHIIKQCTNMYLWYMDNQLSIRGLCTSAQEAGLSAGHSECLSSITEHYHWLLLTLYLIA